MAGLIEHALIVVRAEDLVWLQAHPQPVPVLSWVAERVLVVTWQLWQLLGFG